MPYWVVNPGPSGNVLGNYHQTPDAAIVEAEGVGGWVAYTGSFDRETSQKLVNSGRAASVDQEMVEEMPGFNQEHIPGFNEWDYPGFNGH